MNLASRILPFLCAVLLAGCGSPAPPYQESPDGEGTRVAGTSDAGRPGDGAKSKPVLANDAAAEAREPADARPDRAEDPPADGGEDAGPMVSPRSCSAGHTCTGNTRCQRDCFSGLIYRCSCAEGHFVCTGCISIDGGAPDVKGGPGPCASGVASGRRCDTAGAVCQERSDGGQKLCACGDLGPDRLWVCQ